MKTLIKAFIATSLVGISASSFANETIIANQQLNEVDFSEKKQRLSSYTQLVSFMLGNAEHAVSHSRSDDLILHSIYQNSLNHKKLPEKLVAGR